MNTKIIKYLTNALKIIILSVVGYFIYRAVQSDENFNDDFMRSVEHAMQWENLLWLVVLCSLIAVNWSFEALKWQYLVSKLEQITFFEALKGVLTGLTMSFVSTTNVGAYFGRVWQLRSEWRYKILGGMVVNSLSQTAITYFFGGIGLIYFLTWKGIMRSEWYWMHQIVYMIAAAATVLMVFRSGKLVQVFQKTPRIYQYLEIIKQYTFRDNLIILGFSGLRYLTYFTQFFIVLQLFGIELPLGHILSGITLVYLAKSVIPNFSFLTDLGIREFSAMQLMGSNGYGVPDAMIISATLSLWLINILFPVIVGSIFTWQMRFLSKKKQPEVYEPENQKSEA
ncbi:MAG: lysylphosphatidylglycerol synthase transmembrane domain-containing protein [Flammeovirgaceae bacterium]